jgi:hypothetical protein
VHCVFSEKDGGSLIMGVLVRGLRSADWMPDMESGILNGECCCGWEGIGFSCREEGAWFVTERLDRLR